MATQPSMPFQPSLRIAVENELTVIVQRAQRVAQASGAAVAISDADSQEAVCLASSGPQAPDVGAKVRVRGTFTGLCIQTGKELYCEDAETDAHVDRAAVQALGVRSIVLMPVRDGDRILGALAVFSSSAYAFGSTHRAALRELAHEIAGVLQTQDVSALPKRAQSAALTSISVLEPPSPAPELTKPAGAKEKLDSSLALLSKSPDATVDTAQIKTFFFTAASDQNNGRIDRRWLLIGAVAAILTVSVATALLLKARGGDSSTHPDESQRRPQIATVSQSGIGVPDQKPTEISSPTRPELPHSVNESAVGLEHLPARRDQRRTPSDGPLVVSVSGSRGNPQILESAPQGANPTPGLEHLASSDLAMLTRPAVALPPALSVRSGVVNARLMLADPPLYPEIARAGRIGGSVTLKVNVSKDGKVTSAKVIRGPTVLRQAALDAVKKWIFQPATIDNHAIEQESEVTINFKP